MFSSDAYVTSTYTSFLGIKKSLTIDIDYFNEKFTFVGDWTATGEKVNDRPIYSKMTDWGEKYLSSSSNGYWVFGNTAGSPSGFILEQFDNPSCPHAAQNWQYYNMDDGMFVSDEPMSVDCAVSK